MKRPGLPSLALLIVPFAAILAMGLGIADTPEQKPPSQITCPPLLMEVECREYLAQMKAASTSSQRDTVHKRYAPLLQERARLCHAATGGSCVEVIITPKMLSLPTQGKRTAL